MKTVVGMDFAKALMEQANVGVVWDLPWRIIDDG
jgi:hypothetical protein